ncbi:hypothetical protein MalM25_08370 [Planctomycetes bacterium MalM25]|nr:hypothetical protein MalM25_08370 [Planctomycetes bacterium MalM25]
MPHDLATTNGKPAIAYSGITPWHGLGTRLHRPATAAEVIEAAGLDYEVTTCDLQTSCGLPVPGRRATVRQDSLEVLGTVGPAYEVIANRDCFAFLDALVEEGELRYEVAGALGRGEKIWLLARMPGELRINQTDDVTRPYLMLSNTHDGSASLRVFPTAVRTVCHNTYQLAHRRRRRGQGVSIRHRGDIRGRLEEAREILGLAQRRFQTYHEQANLLARHAMSSDEVDRFFTDLLPPPPKDSPRRRRHRTHERLVELFETGLGQDLPGVRRTLWAAVNAVSEHVDHHQRTRGPDDRTRADRRLHSAFFGPGRSLKQRAFEQALALAT